MPHTNLLAEAEFDRAVVNSFIAVYDTTEKGYWIYLCRRAVHILLTYESDPEIWVHTIEVRNPKNRGKGYGSWALEKLCTWADKHGFELGLRVGPFGESPLSKPETAAWYRRYGFTGRSLERLVRQPLSLESASA